MVIYELEMPVCKKGNAACWEVWQNIQLYIHVLCHVCLNTTVTHKLNVEGQVDQSA